MEALRLENLSKDFGGLRAVNNLSFSIKEEKRVAIIGPNGAGKTTLFNLISGVLPPSSGNIYLYSREVTQLPQYERTKLGLARTYQVTNLFFNFPVMDNVILAKLGQDRSKFNMISKLSSLRNLWEESEQLLEKWGMIEKQKSLVRDLSHGEQRQLELILGLASKPKILLLDEPTAGLGKTETDLVVSNIREFLKEIVVLMIEHDMRVAFAVAERIIVLHQGQIIADGKPDEVRAYPRVREAYLGMQG
jgi:branched-chain amino acid transport system ATP-binding protein